MSSKQKPAKGAPEALADDRHTSQRRAAMEAFAAGRASALLAVVDRLAIAEKARALRGPEVGFVTLRGRTGGTGAPFNSG